MIGLDFGFGALEDELWRVMFLMTRVGAAILAAPLFGTASVPVLVRVCATAAIAIFAAAWMPVNVSPLPLFSVSMMVVVAGEIVMGLALGFVLQLSFAAPQLGAELISGSMGMSMAVTADPGSGRQTTAIGQFFTIALILIFLAFGAHLHWIILVLRSYEAFPPGEVWFDAARISVISSFGAAMFETGLRIALPVTLVLLLVQMFTGVLSRSAPSLNLFALGLPAGILAGIAALIMAAPLIYDQLADLSATALAQAEELLQ